MLQFSTPCDRILHILLHVVDTWKPYKTVTIWPYLVTIWLPYRRTENQVLRCLSHLSLNSLTSLPSFQVFQVLALHAHCPPPVAAREASQVAGSKGLEDVPLNMFYWHWIYCITLTRIVLYYTISIYILSYYIILYIFLCFSMLYRIILAVHCMIVFIILYFIAWYHMIYIISYGIVLFCIAWKHIMLYDIEIWYHVIFCCRLQNAILNRIMLIHIMAKKCTIIQYCSRLCCNINHLNMFINCTPIHHTMIWYNVISHYIYLQCAVLWLQCIPLCHLHLNLKYNYFPTLSKIIVQCIVIRPEQYSANDWIKMNHRLIRSQSI